MLHHGFIHHLADVGKASTALGIHFDASASPRLLFGKNFFHDRRFIVSPDIVLDIGSSVIEAMANQAFHPSLLDFDLVCPQDAFFYLA
jgi:hypothetical protein